MWTLPHCTCRDDGNPSGCILHDPRSDWNRPTPFYAEALPCESCGEPTHLPREWNQEHELWIAQDCSCNMPEEPICPDLLPAMLEARTVGELVEVYREHRRTCVRCGATRKTVQLARHELKEAA